MKKTVCLLLLFSLVLVFACCSAGMTSAEKFLLAVREMDIDAMTAQMTPETAESSRFQEYALVLDSDRYETLVLLYSQLHYTMGEEEGTDVGGFKWISVELILPDMERIREYAETRALVSGEAAYEVVRGLLADGTLPQGYMRTETVSVLMENVDGEWLVRYSEDGNETLLRLLDVTEMLRLFAAG